MRATKPLGVVLLALGLVAMAYGGFSYTRRSEKASIGPITVEVEEKEHVIIPLWAGLGAAIAGGVILARGQARRS